MKIKCLLKDDKNNDITGYIIGFVREMNYTEAIIITTDGKINIKYVHDITIIDRDYV